MDGCQSSGAAPRTNTSQGVSLNQIAMPILASKATSDLIHTVVTPFSRSETIQTFVSQVEISR